MDDAKTTAYVCTISYGPLPAIPTDVHKASYTFTPAKPSSYFRPLDTITFAFAPSAGLSAPTVATLMTAYKAKNANPDNSPFLNLKGAINILTFPTLTIGKNMGTWGVAALFTAETANNSYFFFLPDPEIIVGPEEPGPPNVRIEL